MGKPYILFTQKEHEYINFDFTEGQVTKFIDLWNDGKPISEIAKGISSSQTECALLIMDLHLAGRIQPRKYGIFSSLEQLK